MTVMTLDILSTTSAAYIVASLLFILSLAGLSKHESAKNGLTYGIVGMAVALLFTVVYVIDDTKDENKIAIVLMLSIVIGYYVIGKVAHALHTPLMSVTNAISGVVVVGALLQVSSHDHAIQAVSTVAILLASINIFGGFAVTRRMLGMFSKGA